MIEQVKKIAAGFKKFINKIVNAVKFVMQPIGQIIAILVLVVFAILILFVVVKTLSKTLAKFFNDEYVGLATEGDYDVMVSSLGYAGYESFISEKLWQEYIAFEYAVLMDVADYLYQGQTDFYAGKPGSYEEIDTYNGDGDASKLNTKIKNPLYLPYLTVHSDYDMRLLDHEDWIHFVLTGQDSPRFGESSENYGSLAGTAYDTPGGNRQVVSPTITFEYRTSSYDNAGSLIPYITVVKEDLEYHFYTIGGDGDNGGREKYTQGEYSAEHNTKSGGVVINESNIGDINLMEISDILNLNNIYLPKSTDAANRLLMDPNSMMQSADALDTSNPDNWPVADTVFEQSLYSTNDYGSITYKIPLQQLIDRYLPKASLLTAWYLVKGADVSMDPQGNPIDADNPNLFSVYNLMEDIKNIYNYYCWGGENLSTEKVYNIVYDEDGKVLRDDDGKAVREANATEKYYDAGSNKETFIYFGQAGLETNRFGVYKVYTMEAAGTGKSYPHAPTDITGADDEATIPVVTNLLSDKAYFMDETFTLEIEFDYKYGYHYNALSQEAGWSETRSFRIYDDSPWRNVITVSLGEGGIRSTISTQTQLAMFREEYPDAGSAPINPITVANNRSKYKVTKIDRPPTADYRIISYQHWETTTQSTPEYGEAYATSTTTIEYDQTKVSALGDKNTISDYIYRDVIQAAENEIAAYNPTEGKHEQEKMEEQFLNYEYLFALATDKSGNDVRARVLDDIRNYDQTFAFYNFSVLGDDVGVQMDLLNKTILANAKFYLNDPAFLQLVIELIDDPGDPGDVPNYLRGLYGQSGVLNSNGRRLGKLCI